MSATPRATASAPPPPEALGVARQQAPEHRALLVAERGDEPPVLVKAAGGDHPAHMCQSWDILTAIFGPALGIWYGVGRMPRLVPYHRLRARRRTRFDSAKIAPELSASACGAIGR